MMRGLAYKSDHLGGPISSIKTANFGTSLTKDGIVSCNLHRPSCLGQCMHCTALLDMNTNGAALAISRDAFNSCALMHSVNDMHY